MKSLLVSILLASSISPSFALASTKPKDLPECKDLVTACEAPAAGFKIGGHKSNDTGVWVDCIGARAKGKDVKGISFTQDVAKKCVDAAKADRAANKK